ncbi:MAG: aminoacyl-tRNA hydrolase [Candidatus Omnitrophica bacterium]|nr:aminoacyl-tRNA hydrolase [Candidatus Omnitrophota bacterium]
MKIIAGLGNPGKEYEKTRHNAGFMAIDVLSKKHGISVKKNAFNGLIGQGTIAGKKVMLIKPQTYMNLSGIALKAVADKIENSNDLLVVHDDIDIALGKIRIRSGGSSGGHNGISSIIDQLGTKDFDRLRIGIKPSYEIRDTAEFVLGNLSKEEQLIIRDIVNISVEAIETWLVKDIATCMSLYN